MNYIFLLYNDERKWASMTPEQSNREIGAYMLYTQALRDAGVYVGGNPLQPTSAATTVRVAADGKTSVLDGPYPDTKEQLGGYYVVDVTDLDAAVAWAARCPCANYGSVEVRPIAEIPTPA